MGQWSGKKPESRVVQISYDTPKERQGYAKLSDVCHIGGGDQ